MFFKWRLNGGISRLEPHSCPFAHLYSKYKNFYSKESDWYPVEGGLTVGGKMDNVLVIELSV